MIVFLICLFATAVSVLVDYLPGVVFFGAAALVFGALEASPKSGKTRPTNNKEIR